MASLRMRLILIILDLLLPLPHSFVIRKRSIGYDLRDSDPHPSADWLLGGRADDTPRKPSYLLGGYDDPDAERLALDLLLRRPDADYDDLEDDDPQLDAMERLNLVPGREEDAEKEEEEDEDEGNGEAKLMDKSELEGLFGSASEKEKKKSKGVEQSRNGGSSSKSELTKEDVEKLLSPESKGVMEKVVSETKIVVGASNGSSPSYEGVRVVEVAEKDPNGSTRRQKQTQWLMSPDKQQKLLNGSPESGGPVWLGKVIDDEARRRGEERRGSRKVKRSELSVVDDPERDEAEEEAEEAAAAEQEVEGALSSSSLADREDVELLKAYIRLQTEENRHLEKALNLAISTQVESSDRYLDDEVRQLRMAVQNEEDLETIRDVIRGRQSEDDVQEVEQEEEEEDDNNLEDTEEEETEEIGDGDGEQGDEEEDDDEFSKELLKAKLKKFLIDSAVNDLKETGYGDEGPEEDDDVAVVDDRGSSRDQFQYGNAKVLNPFTRHPLAEYAPVAKRPSPFDDESAQDTMTRGTTDLDIADLLDTPSTSPEQYCPAVRELTDDCLSARRQGLVLDAEAVELCNRHQICYFCGSIFGMTTETCDRGYLGESEQLCSGREKCTREAAGLFLIMAKSHQFLSSGGFTPYDCAAECVYDYIVGETDDRR